MNLGDLIRGVEIKKIIGQADAEITGVAYSSRDIKPGFIFIAVKGERTDGHRYVSQAAAAGAKAAAVEDIPDAIPDGLTVIQVEDTKSTLAEVSANFFRRPSRDLTSVGITGTNGKTTITYLLESIWRESGLSAGVIGTVEYRYGGRRIPSPMTTPESLDLMRLLADMRDGGARCVAVEVSSHALDRGRVRGCDFDAAVFTNLTQDHLDYHGTMENYFEAKKKLFADILPRSSKKKKFSIINFDDPWGEKIASSAGGRIISYSAERSDTHVRPEALEITEEGISALIKTPWGDLRIKSKLFGRHNLMNILAAAAAALSLGAPLEAAERGIGNLVSVPGRLDRVENSLGVTTLVDYAHTPDALLNVLRAVRALSRGKLILVFGCGGDRDQTKRPIMGRIGRELSDVLIITSDNPRSEEPGRIIDEIERGARSIDSAKLYFRIPDRREAIRFAIETASAGDAVLIAGKGHEDYQIIGADRIHFSDTEEAALALEERQNKKT
ncbi:MAG: UDP-N-acetylmuramoyl-L-alanyl-D-glutamate--2,6-diaminopimelate ligase [Deltaproteobacteria bacterium]